MAESLWPDRTSESERHNLRQTLLYVRQLLGSSAVIVDRSHVELNSELDVDVVHVLRVLDRGGDDAERIARAESAVRVYTGRFLQDFDDDWLLEPRAQLSQLYVTALLQLADHVTQETPRQALQFLDRAISEEPLSEGARARKIDALRRLGEHAAANREFQNFKRYLLEELAIEPSPMVEAALKAPTTSAQPKANSTDGFEAAIKNLSNGPLPQQAVELASALTPHWVAKGTGSQGRVLLEAAIERAGDRLSAPVKEAAELALAALCLSQGDLNEGQRWLDLLQGSSDDPLTLTRAYLLSARVATVAFNASKAESFLLKARLLAQVHGFLDEEIETFRRAPRIAVITNDPLRAEALAIEAIEAVEKFGDVLALGDALLTLATAQFANSRTSAAKHSALRALKTVGDLQSPIAISVRTNVVRLLEEMGEVEGIEEGYVRGIAEAKHFESPYSVAVHLTYLGDYLTSQKRFVEAIEVHNEALGLRRELDERLGIATSLRGLGRAYLALGRLSEAREALSESARLFLAAEAMPGHASSLLALAGVEEQLKNSALALRLVSRSLHLLRGMTQLERSSNGPEGDELLRQAERLESSLRVR